MRAWACCVWLLAAGLAAGDAGAQVDSTRTLRTPEQTLRRAWVPGLGQIYNKQYVKLPFVYGGLAAFAGGALLVNERYLLYRHAYLFTARADADGTPHFPSYAGDYARLLRDLNLEPEETLSAQEVTARRARLEPLFRKQRDALRRNRDLLFVGFAVWYGLTILDAFVSAHLRDFDVGADLALSWRVAPAAMALQLTF